jgi:hypothetical protein
VGRGHEEGDARDAADRQQGDQQGKEYQPGQRTRKITSLLRPPGGP